MEKTLYAHQQRIVDKGYKRCLLCWGTGTGKSLAAMELAFSRSPHILVVAPKALKAKWIRDMNEHPKSTGVHKVLTKEEFRAQWDKLDRYPVVIIDEAHHFAGMTSKMSKAALGYMKKHAIVYRYLLTATPFLSTPWNIYMLAHIIGYRIAYFGFLKKFFYNVPMRKPVPGQKAPKKVPIPKRGTEEELAKIVKIIGDVVSLDECVDVPEQTFETKNFVTTPEQRKLMETVAMNETNPVVKFTKYHQIENGTLKGDEYNPDKFVKADKHDHILELVDENKKLAVFCRYNLEISHLVSLLKEKLADSDKKIFVIQGETKDRDAVVQAVESCEDCVVIINAACSEGYELPSVGVAVFSSLSFSYKDYVQAQGRFLRINRLKKNVYIHLVNEGSVDEAVYESIMKKQDFDIAIYSKKHADNNQA